MPTRSLRPDQVATLEAVADTMVPGRRRHPADTAISGVDHSPGAVEAGALDVLTDPVTGIADGVGEMADLLNLLVRSASSADMYGDTDSGTHDGDTDSGTHDGDIPPFVGLTHEQRHDFLAGLCARENPSRELWFLVMLFAYMAYDSAPHLATATAVRQGHVGLTAMGFDPPGDDGLWRYDQHTYGRAMARSRASTDENGNLP